MHRVLCILLLCELVYSISPISVLEVDSGHVRVKNCKKCREFFNTVIDTYKYTRAMKRKDIIIRAQALCQSLEFNKIVSFKGTKRPFSCNVFDDVENMLIKSNILKAKGDTLSDETVPCFYLHACSEDSAGETPSKKPPLSEEVRVNIQTNSGKIPNAPIRTKVDIWADKKW